MFNELFRLKFGYFVLLFGYFSMSIAQEPSNNVPIEFPKNESQYPFVHNTTILKVLASQTNNDTEVDDLLHGGQFANITHQMNDLDQVTNLPKLEENKNVTDRRKWDAELIENGDNTEDDLFDKKFIKSQPSRDHYGSRMPLVHGQIAAILAVVLILLVVVGYVGLLTWRRYIERRYGNRQMLVNEEDFCEPGDLRHFSLE